MKRKGVLKKMIGALCLGALICMPITANAAERADVVGSWVGGLLSVTFDENGMATDQWNTKPYSMESGSITVKYCSSGATETLSYDFWRGYQIKDVPDDTRMDAVIYKIIEPGKMKAWNVFKEAGTSEWQSYDPAILTRGQKKEDKDSNGGSGRECNHNYEWTVTAEPTETEDGVSSYMCTWCGDVIEKQPISGAVAIRRNLLASIENAETGATVTFDNRAWLCYPQYVLDALQEKGDVSLKTDFTYQEVNYSFTIPAGSDYSNLETADFYGFMYLCNAFGGTVDE